MSHKVIHHAISLFFVGDIGYYDEKGHAFITDRLKQLLKVKGYQVHVVIKYY